MIILDSIDNIIVLEDMRIYIGGKLSRGGLTWLLMSRSHGICGGVQKLAQTPKVIQKKRKDCQEVDFLAFDQIAEIRLCLPTRRLSMGRVFF